MKPNCCPPVCAALLCRAILSAGAQTQTPAGANSIPFEQLGAEAQKQYSGDGIGITPTKDGATLKAVFQRLQGQATVEGLWLTSTAEEDKGKPNRFRVRAVKVGRDVRARRAAKPDLCGLLCPPIARAGDAPGLPFLGPVRATKDTAAWLRPGLIEEYTTSMDGIRQDFVVPVRPEGEGELSVSLELTGVRAEPVADGAKLTVEGTGRELAYSRLHVTDATGRLLNARMEVRDIDPTFSDADWVNALVLSGTDLYAGGTFITAGGVSAFGVAKWNGSNWSALGSVAWSQRRD